MICEKLLGMHIFGLALLLSCLRFCSLTLSPACSSWRTICYYSMQPYVGALWHLMFIFSFIDVWGRTDPVHNLKHSKRILPNQVFALLGTGVWEKDFLLRCLKHRVSLRCWTCWKNVVGECKGCIGRAVYLKEFVFMCCFLSRIFFLESGLPCVF